MTSETAEPEAKSLEEVARPFIQMLHDVTGLDTMFLTEVDWQACQQEATYSVNGPRLQTPEGAFIPWSETICRRAMMGGPAHTANVPADYPGNAIAEAFGVQTFVTVPVITPEPGSTIFGTICGASTEALELDDKTIKMIKHVASLIGERVPRERDLEHAARTATAPQDERAHLISVPSELAAAAEQTEQAAPTFE